MRIGIIGAGRIGGKAGRLFACAGHEVLFSYSRDYAKLETLAAQTGNGTRAGAPAEAARFGDVVMLSVPWALVDEALGAAGSLEGKILIDTTNQFGRDEAGNFGVLDLPVSLSAAAFNARRAEGARLVKAYSTMTRRSAARCASPPFSYPCGGRGWDSPGTRVFGFVVAACIWWLYFDYVGSSGLQISPRASFFWGYGHLPIYAGIAASGVGILLAIEGAAETTAHGDLGARAVLGGGLAVYLLAVSFIHWVNRGSLDDRALFARLATAALLILIVPPRFFIPPLVFAALAALALTTFETLSADVPEDPPAG